MFEKTRREYERIDVNIDCTLYLGENKEEIETKILNISENGVALKLDERHISDSLVGKHFTISFIDEYRYFTQNKLSVNTCSGTIVRVQDNLIGCKFDNFNKGFIEYIADKKVEKFLRLE